MLDVIHFFGSDDLFLSMCMSVAMVALTVWVHYEVLYRTSLWVPRIAFLHGRLKIMGVMFGIFLAHTVEVWLYAFCYYLMIRVFQSGELVGSTQSVFVLKEALYYSAVTYTTIGFGDIIPTGGLRLLSGVEALNGLVLIGWSASFTYLYMQKFWRMPNHLNPSHHSFWDNDTPPQHTQLPKN